MLATELGVVGLMNVQFAVHGGEVYVLEVNPRASRTVPFVSKAIGKPLAKIAAKVMAGKTLAELGMRRDRAAPRLGQGGRVPVREVRGRRHDPRPRDALDRRGDGHRLRLRARVREEPARRRHEAADEGHRVPVVREADKPALVEIARRLVNLGFTLVATHGTAAFLRNAGLDVPRHQQGARGPPALRRRDGQPRDRLRHQHDRGRAGDPGQRSRCAAPR